VAGFAASTFLSLVNVQIVEILLAVSEIRQSCGEFIKGDVLIVTLKTQGISLWLIGVIEFCREEFDQYLRTG